MIDPDREITFASAGVTIHASLRAPAPAAESPPESGVAGVPGAIIVPGSGPTDRNGNSAVPGYEGVPLDAYRWIADQLAAHGVASLRYDKLTSGATGLGPYADDPASLTGCSFDEIFVQPVRDGLGFLAAQPGIDAERLLLVGHSEGGLISLVVASDPGSAPAPAGLMLLEPQYGRILDIVARQLDDQLALAGIEPAEIAALGRWIAAGVDRIRNSGPPFGPPGPSPLPAASGVTAQWQAAIASVLYGRMWNRLAQSEDALDPVALAGSVRVPTLVTAGTKDFNTPLVPGGPPGSGVAALAGAFPGDTANLVVLADTHHELRDIGDTDPMTLTNPADLLKFPYSPTLAIAIDEFLASWLADPSGS
ncbi:MAG: alpha/beta hydrolase [Acidimicrobiales bacterium]